MPNRELPRAVGLPWYREPWVWGIIGGPAIVVVAGVWTLWLAVASYDGLVADDYYKRGLAINQVFTREHAARAAGFEARLMFAPRGGGVRVLLSGDTLPDALMLRLAHPTRAGMDATARLARSGAGVYEGRIEAAADGRWQVVLEDEAGRWRLSGDVTLPAAAPAVLGARTSPGHSSSGL
jgi:hypothetical protein